MLLIYLFRRAQRVGMVNNGEVEFPFNQQHIGTSVAGGQRSNQAAQPGTYDDDMRSCFKFLVVDKIDRHKALAARLFLNIAQSIADNQSLSKTAWAQPTSPCGTRITPLSLIPPESFNRGEET